MWFSVYKNLREKARKAADELETRGCFEKELEKEHYMLYNQFRTNETVSNS